MRRILCAGRGSGGHQGRERDGGIIEKRDRIEGDRKVKEVDRKEGWAARMERGRTGG